VKRNDCISIDIFDDRIEISSPGELIPPMTEAALQTEHASVPRNLQIARIFYLYGYFEHAGSGIARMREALERESLPLPKFYLTKDKRFKVTFYRPQQGLLARLKEKEVATSEDKRYRISRRTFWISLVGATVSVATISGESVWLIASRQISAQQSQLSQQQLQITQLQQQQQGLPRLELNPHRITLTLVDVNGILSNSPGAIADVKQQLRAQPVLANREVGLAIVYAGAPNFNSVPRAQAISNKIYSILASLGQEGFAFAHASYYDPLYSLGSDSQVVSIDMYLFDTVTPTPVPTTPTVTPTPATR